MKSLKNLWFTYSSSSIVKAVNTASNIPNSDKAHQIAEKNLKRIEKKLSRKVDIFMLLGKNIYTCL